MPGATGLIVFGGELASDPDGLIHAIRQQVEEISSAGGELFDVLKSGEMVLVHWVYPPEKKPRSAAGQGC